MEVFKMVLTVIFIIVCIALTVIVLLQEGKQAGLGAISGVAETYWGKNKGRSMEGKLEKSTRVLVIAFLVVAVLLNIPFNSSSSTGSNSNGVTDTSGTSIVPSTATDGSATTQSNISGTSAQ